jgi:hypothetical protein
MTDVTQILEQIQQGDPRAAKQFMPLVFEELRRLAKQNLANEKPGQTLQATALVHESYLRLVGTQDPGWNGRGHFFASAAEAMRRILSSKAEALTTERARPYAAEAVAVRQAGTEGSPIAGSDCRRARRRCYVDERPPEQRPQSRRRDGHDAESCLATDGQDSGWRGSSACYRLRRDEPV